MGYRGAVDPAAAERSAGRTTAARQSTNSGGYRVSTANGLPMESRSSCLRHGLDFASSVRGVDARGLLHRVFLSRRALVSAAARREPGVGQLGRIDGQGSKRGDRTGPNPTDRAKSGVKRHILTDADGIPVSAITTAANVPDMRMVDQALDRIVLRAPRGPRRPRHLCLDKGYDYSSCEQALRARRIIPHIRRRGEPPLLGCVLGMPRRWVVERTHSWINRCRALLVRWERIGDHYEALLHLGCALIVCQQGGQR